MTNCVCVFSKYCSISLLFFPNKFPFHWGQHFSKYEHWTISWNLSEMQIFDPHPRSTNLEISIGGPSSPCLNKPSRWFQHTIKFDKNNWVRFYISWSQVLSSISALGLGSTQRSCWYNWFHVYISDKITGATDVVIEDISDRGSVWNLANLTPAHSSLTRMLEFLLNGQTVCSCTLITSVESDSLWAHGL